MKKKIATRLVRLADGKVDSLSRPKAPPIYLSSAFSFDSVEDLEEVYRRPQSGFIYTRQGNPQHRLLGELVAAAEECQETCVTATGMAAIACTVLALTKKGDHVLAESCLYGGTLRFFKEQLPRFGIEVTFFKSGDRVKKLIRPSTRLIYVETITNPLITVPDLQRLAGLAHRRGVKLVVDNTFATPVVCRPSRFGADVVVHSATKYLCGHSDVMGGVVLADRKTAEAVHSIAILYGPTLSPFDAWLLLRSMRTLELRVRRHSENALALARFLQKQGKIRKVHYPGLESSPFHEIAGRSFDHGLYGGMLAIELAGGEAAAGRLISILDGVKLVPSLAGVTTSISYPSRTSHRNLSAKEKRAVGIAPGLLRISVGLEDAEDLKQEFARGLKEL